MDGSKPASRQRIWLDKANILVEALPYMQKYRHRYVLIKVGGENLLKEEHVNTLARDMMLLQHIGAYPIIVHGGGKQVGGLLKQLNIATGFNNGMRITDKPTMDVVEMVLGRVNKNFVAAIGTLNGKAVGLSGKDAKCIIAEKLHPDDGSDLGFVGKPKHIDTSLIISLCKEGFIPVIAPVACDSAGTTYNINADLVAGAFAVALRADRLLYLSDVGGVYDESKTLRHKLSLEQTRSYLANNIVTGGMIPKLLTCMQAVELGVSSAVILNGLVPHIILLELFTDLGAGTLITSS